MVKAENKRQAQEAAREAAEKKKEKEHGHGGGGGGSTPRKAGGGSATPPKAGEAGGAKKKEGAAKGKLAPKKAEKSLSRIAQDQMSQDAHADHVANLRSKLALALRQRQKELVKNLTCSRCANALVRPMRILHCRHVSHKRNSPAPGPPTNPGP